MPEFSFSAYLTALVSVAYRGMIMILLMMALANIVGVAIRPRRVTTELAQAAGIMALAEAVLAGVLIYASTVY